MFIIAWSAVYVADQEKERYPRTSLPLSGVSLTGARRIREIVDYDIQEEIIHPVVMICRTEKGDRRARDIPEGTIEAFSKL